MSAFNNATLMITGGTGSFGSTVLKHFLDSDLKEIRIFSRDEKKQDDMRHELQARHPESAGKVKFYIGDVRNPQSIRDAMPGVDYVFHAAALKQVPSCEFFPMEAVRTNVEGTDNVLHAAIEAGVKRVVCLSTDKAAYPINAMGISKAMMEHVIYANARVAAERGGTVICCTRYGNVMCSRGSVIPLFIDQIKAGNPITITDLNMTRFLMNLDEAVDLVMFAFQHANPGDLFIQKADACTIGDLAKAVQQLFGDTGTNLIGTRHGEKLYETLMTKEERMRRIAAAFSESYDEKYRKIADAIAADGSAGIDFYVAEAGDDYAVVCMWDEQYNESYIRYSVSWGEDGMPSVSGATEVKPAFVPVGELEQMRADAAEAVTLRAQVTEKSGRIAELEAQVQKLEKAPAAQPAHEAVKTSAMVSETGDKGLDRLARIMSAE